ncbi:MAG: cellulose synthase catalytic subunit, partial [Leptolyngbya sp. SIO1D8]|nr:cellulose synthase catalytic subunit [Leptolyngbya sp. SIO1D8]
LMLGIALLILLDAPRPSPYEWFNVQRIARLKLSPSFPDQDEAAVIWGFTTMISEVGAEFSFTKPSNLPSSSLTSQPVELELVDEQITLPGIITQVHTRDEFPTFTIQFASLPLPQQRRLVELLFCRPGQWQSRCSPNELHSLWLIFKSLLRPRFIVERQVETKPVMVSKV